ncbi:CD99 molecule isoform X2 [Brachyistius frenatus]|uniref:CD99 molecule isoform X2 n=1 Tax=Brachyistius frenatus TaxID=100188 RepID=UPI0037E9AB89
MQLFPANMRLGVTVVLLLFVTGTLSQEFDLGDAIGDPLPTPAKPKELPKTPDNPQPDGGLSFDLGDAVDEGKPKTQTEKPKKPSSGDSGDSFGFDLEDALKPDPNPKPDKPAVNPPREGGGGGGGGTFDDSDLVNVGAGDYKPDGGNSGGNGGDPGYDPHGGADQPQDPDLLCGHILKMLNANIPEDLLMWMSHLKQVLSPLVQRAMELLQALP